MTTLHAKQKTPDLEQLFRDAADDLARYFSRRHGDAEASRDLVQDTFVEMAKGLEKGARPESPRAYLFGIARHVSRIARKRGYREREGLLPQTTDSISAAPNVAWASCPCIVG